ncbi:mismatch repair endonuclease PMS2 [Onthophagus taurus]|uniref:mismatch repair endonuclease PMS2 n=1 Tax=Onthophagus taurus TaxID=166361 RepID=UPI0039BEAC33
MNFSQDNNYSDENNIKDEINQIIKPINTQTVHKICSGQVVLTLAVAVKELVENALDAGATTIEVKLKEYGSELIEVIDNGGGVIKENFAALTLKHYTSKIKEFNDLEFVETLGFRGEALSSLCALSDVTIITRHSSANIATKITYDHNGKIIDESSAPRSKGTTVCLSNLFITLPVRRREFLKNLKREFNKMCQLLYAYCLISTNVKITCINQLSKGSKSTVVSTQGSHSIRDNIINVFGAKQIASLIDINTVDPVDDVLKEYGIENRAGNEKPFKFVCFISSVTHGLGRSIADRQFIYINSRPCEPPKILKLINETYKQYNSHQYPFVFLNILTERNQIDVNVTPDKRQIFFQKEKLLLAYLKSSLLDSFKNFPSTYDLQNLDIFKDDKKALTQITLNNSLKGLKRSNSNNNEEGNSSLLDAFRKKPKVDNNQVKVNDLKLIFGKIDEKAKRDIEPKYQKIPKFDDKIETDLEKSPEKELKLKDESKSVECKFTPAKPRSIIDGVIDVENIPKYDSKDLTILKEDSKKMLDISLGEIRCRIKKRGEYLNQAKDEIKKVLFRAEISPTQNSTAEQELQKQITKDKFKEMEIIGQFNLGFIVAKLKNDLFIIDQHATDEKYNFEQLQANTILETQNLVHPKSLNLTAANECLLIDNEETFKKNGFTFTIDHNAEPTQKIKLTSLPLSKNYIFGKDDIDELLFILQETAQTICRPSRVRQMFASRACRKSVMIGKALTHSDMRKLVDHMGEIDQPWNCPHGRPTMRHLVNLDLIKSD